MITPNFKFISAILAYILLMTLLKFVLIELFNGITHQQDWAAGFYYSHLHQ
jgi:hypothetical protein